MNETYRALGATARSHIPDLILAGVRLVVAWLVARPALSKALTYGSSVAFFSEIGIPHPAVMVFVVGAVEILAVVMLLVGAGGRLAALALLPVMLVAIATVGPDWKNLTVLVGAVVLLVGGTGSVSSWRPTDRFRG